jgi:hypothetical protein
MPRETAPFSVKILASAMFWCLAACNVAPTIAAEDAACRLTLPARVPLDQMPMPNRPCMRRAPPVGAASGRPSTEEAAQETGDDSQELGDEEPAELGRTSASCRESFERALHSVRQSFELEREAPEVLVATVPDPIDSGLASAHASAIEAILLGAERSGYARDVSWMPWSSPTQSACRTMEPGVLVLRQQSGSSRGPGARPPWLLVFIVGETPTFGVHPLAFYRAIRSVEAFRGWQALTLIGPYFTGASASIRDGLCATGRTAEDTRIVTGSATGDDLETNFAPYPIHRLIARDSDLEQFFFRYLVDVQNVRVSEGRESGILPGVAVLRESGSGWGAERSELETHRDELRSGPFHPEIQLTFPMRIAALRREYAKLARRQREEPVSSRTPLEVAELSIPLEFDERARIPSAPYEATPQLVSAMDQSLRRLLAQVAHARVQYIGIEATDTADSIFLTRRLRDLAPDARVFLLSSDILYSRHDKPVTMTGTYVVSSYPFLGVHDFWNGDPQRRHDAFSNDSAEGIYNAVAFALSARCSAAREIGFCEPSGTFAVQASAPAENEQFLHDIERLPIWLGVIGMSGFEPIWFREGSHRTNTRPNTCLEIDPRVMPPNTWHLVLFLIGFGIAVDRRRLASHLLHLGRESRTPNIAAAHRDLAGYIVGRRAAGWIALVWMTAIHVGAISATYRSGSYRLGLATGVLLASWAIATFDLWPRPKFLRPDEQARERFVLPRVLLHWWNSRSRSDARDLPSWLLDIGGLGRPALFVGLLALLTLGLFVWTVTVHPFTESEYHSGRLFSLRTLSIVSGASAATPIVLSLATTWLLFAARTTLVSDFLKIYACVGEEGRAGGPLANLLRTRHGTIDPSIERDETTLWRVVVPRVGTNGLGAVVLLFAIPVFALAIKNPSTLENWWGRFALLGPIVVLGAMIGSFGMEFVTYSSHLRRLLHSLLLRPVAAFLHLVPLPLAMSVDRMLSMSADDRMKISVILADWKAYIETHPQAPNPSVPHTNECALFDQVSRLNCTLDEELIPQAPRSSTTRRDTPQYEPRVFHRSARSDGDAHPATETPPEQESGDRSKSAEGELVASFAAVFVARYVRILRHYMGCLTVSGLLLLVTVSSYPFQPRQLFSLGAWIVIGSVSVACITVFLRFDRSTLLSRISRTEPGHFTMNGALALRVFTYVVIPLLSLFASQNPQVMHAIYRAIEPFLRVIG